MIWIEKAYYNFIMLTWDIVKNQIPSLKTNDYVNKTSLFKINANKLFIAFERKIYKASNLFLTYIDGFINIPKHSDSIIFKWKLFASLKISMEIEEDNSLFKQEWYGMFPDIDPSEDIGLHIVVKKSDITMLECFDSEDAKSLQTISNLQ